MGVACSVRQTFILSVVLFISCLLPVYMFLLSMLFIYFSITLGCEISGRELSEQLHCQTAV